MRPLVLIAAEMLDIRPLAKILEKRFDIAIALNGEKAVLSARKRKPDVILLDEKFRFADGRAVCPAFCHKHTGDQEIPVLFLLDDVANRGPAWEQGAVDYLQRPFESAEILSRVQTFVSLSQTRQDQERYNESLKQMVAERTRSLEESRRETIFMLARAGEFNDTDTGVHIWRMAAYAKMLAQALGVGAKECEQFHLAAPMHDIGKIGIPDSILKKPGKLDAGEWEIMKTHATIGRDILLESQDPLFQLGTQIAHQHHERWDGGGYPQGLKKESISIWARIVAVADVFDALTMERPYKKAWLVKDALDALRADSAAHFDPKVVSVFETIFPEIVRIREAFNEKQT